VTKKQITRGLAGAAAVAALAVAGAAVSSGSNSPSESAAAQRPANGTFNGTPPSGARPNFGTPVAGAAAEKARAAALAKYPGQVEWVMKAPSGNGYEVHVISADGSEVHVLVSAGFQVTATETGPPGRGQMPNGGTPPSGATPPSSSTGSTQTT
jgi:outer membrane lipoprotein-sorting protein